jgi:hypothetical protein
MLRHSIRGGALVSPDGDANYRSGDHGEQAKEPARFSRMSVHECDPDDCFAASLIRK